LVAAAPAAAGIGRRLGAASEEARPVTVIRVVELSGLIDPVLVDFTTGALDAAERAGAEVLVIRLDSPGGVVSQAAADALAFRLSHAAVPVAVWVGPGRQARAYGTAFQLLQAAAVSGVAPGARVGRAPDPVLGGDNPLRDRTVGADEALARQVVQVRAATLGDFVVALDGRAAGTRVLSVPTEVVTRPGRPPQRALAPTVRVRFDEPSLVAQVLHAVATPSVAYLLFVVGLLLVVFEFFTAGVGMAAVAAAGSLVLSSSGLGVLPTRPGALLLVALGVVGYAIDVQAGEPRAWTVIGTVSFVAGSATLYAGLSVPLAVLAAVVVGVALFMVAGMPAMVRARFSTTTIGRESMLGEMGRALGDLAPEGVVQVRDAPWRARTNRATPIRAGEPVRVTGIHGLLLEVEPEEGGARDARH
jgi:membrane-bound serine protease (ClpP class)